MVKEKYAQLNNIEVDNVVKEMKEAEMSKLIEFLINEVELLEARLLILEK